MWDKLLDLATKDFKTVIIIEKQQNMNTKKRDIKDIKKNQVKAQEPKNTISKIKNLLDLFNSKLDTGKEKNQWTRSESKTTTQIKAREKKKMKKNKQWQDIKQYNVHITQVPEREERVQNKFSRNNYQKFPNFGTNTKKSKQSTS